MQKETESYFNKSVDVKYGITCNDPPDGYKTSEGSGLWAYTVSNSDGTAFVDFPRTVCRYGEYAHFAPECPV